MSDKMKCRTKPVEAMQYDGSEAGAQAIADFLSGSSFRATNGITIVKGPGVGELMVCPNDYVVVNRFGEVQLLQHCEELRADLAYVIDLADDDELPAEERLKRIREHVIGAEIEDRQRLGASGPDPRPAGAPWHRVRTLVSAGLHATELTHEECEASADRLMEDLLRAWRRSEPPASEPTAREEVLETQQAWLLETLATVRRGLAWMASFSDDSLRSAATLHWDMNGKAKELLRAIDGSPLGASQPPADTQEEAK